MNLDRASGAMRRIGTSATSAGLVGLLCFACESDSVRPWSAGHSGGAGASTGGTISFAGGSRDTPGGATNGSGGTAPGGSSPGTLGSGGMTSSTGGSSGGPTGGADSGAVPDSGADDPDVSVPRPRATTLTLPTTMDDPKVQPWFKVYRPADLAGAVAATGHKLPVVAWADGGCFRVAAPWEALYERWAAGGFVVLALDVGPDGNALVQTTVDDQARLLTWALEEAEKPGSPYAGKLDMTRIVAAGNSCGGVTALGVAARDDRVKSVFVLSGSSALASTDARIMGAIAAPVGYIVGGVEDIAAANAAADYAAMGPNVPAMIMSRSSGDHVLVSTEATALEQAAEISLDWMDLTLYGTRESLAGLTSLSVCSTCSAGTWTLKSKHLDTLRR